MTYYIFIENNKLNGAGQAQILDEEVTNLEVSQEVYNSYLENPDKYIWNGSEITTNPDYDAICAEKARLARIEEIKQELSELDNKRIRAMCEPSEYAAGVSWLEYYNEQAQDLRAELQSLEA